MACLASPNFTWVSAEVFVPDIHNMAAWVESDLNRLLSLHQMKQNSLLKAAIAVLKDPRIPRGFKGKIAHKIDQWSGDKRLSTETQQWCDRVLEFWNDSPL